MAYRTSGAEFAIIATGESEATWAALGRSASAALSECPAPVQITARYGWAVLPRDAGSPAEAIVVASRRLRAAPERAADPAAQAAAVLVRAIAERDAALALHLAGVADLAVAVARRAGLGDDEVHEIERAAQILDIGMLTVPLAVLQKPGPLDEDEIALVRRHTIAGARVAAAAPALANCARLIRSSHERYDGGGYPDGLSGTSIPVGARILAACDAFAAMVTDRPYRRSLSYPAAVAELQRCTGTQFDPAVVSALLAELEDETSLLADAV